MSQDPAPYSTTPQPEMIRIALALCADSASPYQGIVMWRGASEPIELVRVTATWALMSKS